MASQLPTFQPKNMNNLHPFAQTLSQNPKLIKQWAQKFKDAADNLTPKFQISADDLKKDNAIKDLLQAYTVYGAYQIACKAVVNF